MICAEQWLRAVVPDRHMFCVARWVRQILKPFLGIEANRSAGAELLSVVTDSPNDLSGLTNDPTSRLKVCIGGFQQISLTNSCPMSRSSITRTQDGKERLTQRFQWNRRMAIYTVPLRRRLNLLPIESKIMNTASTLTPLRS